MRAQTMVRPQSHLEIAAVRVTRPDDDRLVTAGRPSRRAVFRLYVLPEMRRLTLDVAFEGYPDGPGRASYKEGESWGIIAKLSLESTPRNCVMRWRFRGIERRKLGVHPRQIQNRIDLANKMIGRNNLIEMKLIEQLALIAIQTSHHRKTSQTWCEDGISVRCQQQPTFATKSALH